jgi:hypothetical protein
MAPAAPTPPPNIPIPPEPDFARALHDFVPSAGSTTCLSFKAGQLIRIHNKDASGWWDAEVDGRRGWLPSNFVEAWDPHAPDFTSVLRDPSTYSGDKVRSSSLLLVHRKFRPLFVLGGETSRLTPHVRNRTPTDQLTMPSLSI